MTPHNTLWHAALTLATIAIAVPRAQAQITDFKTPPLHGELVLKSMPPSRVLKGRQITTWVYLPPGYNAPRNKGRRYPVVYLLHGEPSTLR